jgi:RND superfamily putative drug exporter
VIAALLCLLAADVNSTRGLAPIAAIGVALAMLANLTLLPALLLICGRRAFWPFVPLAGSSGADQTHGPWRRVAELISRRHRTIAPAVVAVLAVLCIGLVDLHATLSGNNQFTGVVQSAQGQAVISAHFPPGASAPLDVVVADPSRLDAVRSAIAEAPGISRAADAISPPITGRQGISLFTAELDVNPTTARAYDLILPLRRIAKAAGGASTLTTT